MLPADEPQIYTPKSPVYPQMSPPYTHRTLIHIYMYTSCKRALDPPHSQESYTQKSPIHPGLVAGLFCVYVGLIALLRVCGLIYGYVGLI